MSEFDQAVGRHLERDTILLSLCQAPTQRLFPVSACGCLPAGNSDDSSDGTSSDDEMDVAEEPRVCPPALSVQVPSSMCQAVEPAAGSLELAVQEAQDPQLCRSVDCLLCDSLEALVVLSGGGVRAPPAAASPATWFSAAPRQQACTPGARPVFRPVSSTACAGVLYCS